MKREEFETLFQYNDWANYRILSTLSKLYGVNTDLSRHADMRVRTVHSILVHILGAYVIWRNRWEGTSLSAMLDPGDFPTLNVIDSEFQAERGRLHAFFETLPTEATLENVIHYRNTSGEPYQCQLGQMMQHVLNHGTYHRGQITGLLLDMGHGEAVVSTDLIAFYYEQQQSMA